MASKPDFDPVVTFIPTPIGNLGDITLRAIETLRNADLIACEDTRHSRKLLNHLEISRPLISLHDHNEDQRIPELITRAQKGEKIAIISDAGTPCLSDPGHRFLKACRDQNIDFTVLPGPSAITTALVASGFPPHPFSFQGFLHVKKGKREKQLQQALTTVETTLFFESPHRLPSTLDILTKLAPDHPICVARELTKAFETLHHGSSTEVKNYFSERKVKGEIVLLIPPPLKESKADKYPQKDARG